MKPLWTLICLLLAGPATAQQSLSPAEFEAYVTGKTLYYGQYGLPYGVEEYFGNRRVRWSFLDGECKDGRWYAQRDLICFVYDDSPQPQCWRFFMSGNALTARFEEPGEPLTLYEVSEAREPMICLGPKIGV